LTLPEGALDGELQSDNDFDKWDFRNPKTGKSIRFSKRATALTELYDSVIFTFGLVFS